VLVACFLNEKNFFKLARKIFKTVKLQLKNKPIINNLFQYIGGGVKMEEETNREDLQEQQQEPTE